MARTKRKVVDLTADMLNAEEKQRLRDLIEEYHDVFCLKKEGPGNRR